MKVDLVIKESDISLDVLPKDLRIILDDEN